MVRQDLHHPIVDRVVLFVGDTRLPEKSVWLEVFRNCDCVTVSDEQITDTDAVLASVYRCEDFGCRSGSSDNTLGVMNVYDSWEFEKSNQSYPRFFISNAVWRDDPSLNTAIVTRLDILAETIAKFNRDTHHTIRSVTIECANLGFWCEYSEEDQFKAIQLVRAKLEELFDR